MLSLSKDSEICPPVSWRRHPAKNGSAMPCAPVP